MGVVAAVGGHLISPHLMLPAARRVLLQRDHEDPRYALIVTRRHWALGCMTPPGSILLLPSLREAVQAVRQGVARPADRRTAVDVELALLLERALPRAA